MIAANNRSITKKLNSDAAKSRQWMDIMEKIYAVEKMTPSVIKKK